jgi:hypothetical protein
MKIGTAMGSTNLPANKQNHYSYGTQPSRVQSTRPSCGVARSEARVSVRPVLDRRGCSLHRCAAVVVAGGPPSAVVLTGGTPNMYSSALQRTPARYGKEATGRYSPCRRWPPGRSSPGSGASGCPDTESALCRAVHGSAVSECLRCACMRTALRAHSRVCALDCAHARTCMRVSGVPM